MLKKILALLSVSLLATQVLADPTYTFSPSPAPRATKTALMTPSDISGMTEGLSSTGLAQSYWGWGYYWSNNYDQINQYYEQVNAANEVDGTNYTGGYRSSYRDDYNDNDSGNSSYCYSNNSCSWNWSYSYQYAGNSDFVSNTKITQGYRMKTGMQSLDYWGRKVLNSYEMSSYRSHILDKNTDSQYYNDPVKFFTDNNYYETQNAYRTRITSAAAGSPGGWLYVGGARVQVVAIHVINNVAWNKFALRAVVLDKNAYPLLVGRGLERELFSAVSAEVSSTANYNYGNRGNHNSGGCGGNYTSSYTSTNVRRDTYQANYSATGRMSSELRFTTENVGIDIWNNWSGINSSKTVRLPDYKPYVASFSSMYTLRTNYVDTSNSNDNSNSSSSGCYCSSDSSSSGSSSSRRVYETKVDNSLRISGDRVATGVTLFFHPQNNKFAAISNFGSYYWGYYYGYGYYYYGGYYGWGSTLVDIDGEDVDIYPTVDENNTWSSTSSSNYNSNSNWSCDGGSSGGGSWYSNSSSSSNTTQRISASASSPTRTYYYTYSYNSSWSNSDDSDSDSDSDTDGPREYGSNYVFFPHGNFYPIRGAVTMAGSGGGGASDAFLNVFYTTMCNDGYVRSGNTCVEACADGAPKTGGVCPCPAGKVRVGNNCVDPCPPGQSRDKDGNCVTLCPDGSTPVNGLCPCPSGQTRINGVCRPPCAPGQVRNALDECVNPCPDGTIPQNGICPCPTGQVRLLDGTCGNLCADGSTPVNGLCPCPVGQVRLANGSCGNNCPNGGVAVNGICPCPPGEARQADGSCSNLCPDGTTPVNGVCPCPAGTFRQLDGTCGNNCPDGSAPINGSCPDLTDTVSLPPANLSCPSNFTEVPRRSSKGNYITYTVAPVNGKNIAFVEEGSDKNYLRFVEAGTTTLTATWGTPEQTTSSTVSYSGSSSVSNQLQSYTINLTGSQTVALTPTLIPSATLTPAQLSSYAVSLAIKSGSSVSLAGGNQVVTSSEGQTVVVVTLSNACSLGSFEVTINVTKGTTSLAIDPVTCAVSPIQLGASSASTGFISYRIAMAPPGAVAYIQEDALVTNMAGSYSIVASQEDDDLYNKPADVAFSVEVLNNASAQITTAQFTHAGVPYTTRTLTGGSYTLVSTSNSPRTPVYTIETNTSNATIEGSNLVWTKPGVVSVKVTYPGDGCYREATAIATLTLSQLADVVTFVTPAHSCATPTVVLGATSSLNLPIFYRIISDTTSSSIISGTFVWSGQHGSAVIQAYTLNQDETFITGDAKNVTLTFAPTTPVAQSPIPSGILNVKVGDVTNLPLHDSLTTVYSIVSGGSNVLLSGNRLVAVTAGTVQLRATLLAADCYSTTQFDIEVRIRDNMPNENTAATFVVLLKPNTAGQIVISALPPKTTKYNTDADLNSPVTLTVIIQDADLVLHSKKAIVNVYLTDNAQGTVKKLILTELLDPANLGSWRTELNGSNTRLIRDISVNVTEAGFHYWGAQYIKQ